MQTVAVAKNKHNLVLHRFDISDISDIVDRFDIMTLSWTFLTGHVVFNGSVYLNNFGVLENFKSKKNMAAFFSTFLIDRKGLKVKRKKLNESQVSGFRCQISHVTFCMSDVICHMAHFNCHLSHVSGKRSEVTIPFYF